MPTLNDWGESWNTILNQQVQYYYTSYQQNVYNSMRQEQQFRAVDQEKKKVGLRLSGEGTGDVFLQKYDTETGEKIYGNRVLIGSKYWNKDEFMFCERYKLISNSGFKP